MTEIPRWKVQAALRLLGLDPEEVHELRIEPWPHDHTAHSNTVRALVTGKGYVDFPITDTVEDTRLHVLGIDPENGNAELNPVPDNDVRSFIGANMYLDGGTKHSNGTMMPVYKRRS